MEDYKQTIKERVEELPQGLQTFIKNESWRSNVSKVGKQFNFGEESLASLENEVFLCLICLEPVADLKDNLKRELIIDENLARRITDSINGSVFAPVMKDIKEFLANTSQNPALANSVPANKALETKPEPPKDNVGDSFEQAILNQAKAMQIAKPAQSVQTPTPQPKPITPVTTTSTPINPIPKPVTPPTNLPGAENMKESPSGSIPPTPPQPNNPPTPKESLTTVPKYTGSTDPYREPIE